MRNKTLTLTVAVLLIGSFGCLALAQEKQQEKVFTGPNYLYINELEIPTGTSANEAIALGSNWVNVLRETGEFKCVRLFMHSFGPQRAMYLIMKPNSWQSLETGFQKAYEAMPGFMDLPWKWGAHSDNILSEIPVAGAKKPQEEAEAEGTNYLYIEYFEIGTGQVINEAIAQATQMVRLLRETVDFKNVELYMHNTGPRLALYILIEPNSWQAIETGFEKWQAAVPELMTQPWMWGSHGDNLLAEIPVK